MKETGREGREGEATEEGWDDLWESFILLSARQLWLALVKEWDLIEME